MPLRRIRCRAFLRRTSAITHARAPPTSSQLDRLCCENTGMTKKRTVDFETDPTDSSVRHSERNEKPDHSNTSHLRNGIEDHALPLGIDRTRLQQRVLLARIAHRVDEAPVQRERADLARPCSSPGSTPAGVLLASGRLRTTRSIASRHASIGERPCRISSTTRKLAALRIISSPTPEAVAAPTSLSTYSPAPTIGLSPTRPCSFHAMPLVVHAPARRPSASSARMPSVSWLSCCRAAARARR